MVVNGVSRNINSSGKAQGFTLVELMVVVAMVSILAVTTIPLGKVWIDVAKVKSTESELREAIGKAKSLALRNEFVAPAAEGVAAICLPTTGNMLYIRTRSATEAPDCAAATGKVIWGAEISDDVSLTAVGNAVSCVCYGSNGLLSTGDGCNACLSGNEMVLDTGSKTKTLLMH